MALKSLVTKNQNNYGIDFPEAYIKIEDVYIQATAQLNQQTKQNVKMVRVNIDVRAYANAEARNTTEISGGGSICGIKKYQPFRITIESFEPYLEEALKELGKDFSPYSYDVLKTAAYMWLRENIFTDGANI